MRSPIDSFLLMHTHLQDLIHEFDYIVNALSFRKDTTMYKTSGH